MSSLVTLIWAYASHTSWMESTDIIPKNQVILTSDFYGKVGDGTKTYAELPIRLDPTLAEISDPAGQTIQDIKNDIIALQQTTASQGTSITSIIGTLDTYGQRIAAVEAFGGQISDLNAGLTALGESVDAFDAWSRTTDAKIINLQTQVDALTGGIDLSAIQEQIDNLSTSLTALRDNTEAGLNAANASITQHVNQTGNVHSLARTDIGAASEQEVSDLSAAVSSATTTVTAMNSRVTAAEGSITTINTRLTGLDQSMSVAEATIVDTQSQLLTHNHEAVQLLVPESIKRGQVPFATAAVASEDDDSPATLSFESLIVDTYATETADEFTAASVHKISGLEQFSSWKRFSHSRSVQPANETELASWEYIEETDTLRNLTNSATYVGMYSDKKYSDYVLKATLSSTNNDDDTIAVVGAFAIDANGFQHTLSFVRTPGGSKFDNITAGWFCVYNVCITNTEFPDYNSSVIAVDTTHITMGNGQLPGSGGATAGWGTVPNGTRIHITRIGNLIEAKTTNWSDVNTYVEESLFTIDLESDPRLAVFMTEASVGIGTWSQAASSIKINSLVDSTERIYDLQDGGKSYVYDPETTVWSPEQNEAGTTLSIWDNIGPGRFVRNGLSGKLFYTTDTGYVVVAQYPAAASTVTEETSVQYGTATLTAGETVMTISLPTAFESEIVHFTLSRTGTAPLLLSYCYSVINLQTITVTITFTSTGAPVDDTLFTWEARGK